MEILLAAGLAIAFAAVLAQSDRAVAIALVVAMFVTRPALAVGGATLRLELMVSLACALSFVFGAMSKRPLARLGAATWSSIALVLGWMAAVAIATLSNAPQPSSSMSVWAWCLGNIVAAVWIARHPRVWPLLLKAGTACAALSSAAAIVLWLFASAGLTDFGVQEDPAYGGSAAYVFSLEANVLAGLICLWALLAAYNPGGSIPRTLRNVLLFIAPIAILTTHTRAALVALVLGLVILLIVRRRARRAVLTTLLVGAGTVWVLFAVSADEGLSKFFELFDTESGTGGLRERVNSHAFEEWASSRSVFEGLGFNSFGQRNFDLTRPELAAPGYIGNLPLQIVYDGGIIAALLLAGATALVLGKFVKLRRLGLVLAIAVPYVAFSIATSTLWFLETWLFVGLAWGYPQPSWANSVADSPSRLAVPLRMAKG